MYRFANLLLTHLAKGAAAHHFLFLQFGRKQDPVTSQEVKDKTVGRKHGRRKT